MADLYYIEEGYYEAGYFVYTADAAAAVSSSATISVSAVATIESSQALSVTASFTCTISHIHGADLVALSDAAVTTIVDRIRPGAGNISSTATLSADGAKTLSGASAVTGSASVSAIVGKIIDVNDAYPYTWDDLSSWENFVTNEWRPSGIIVVSEFILSGELTEIVGEVVEAYGTWSSESSLSTTVNRFVGVSSSQSSEFAQSAQAFRVAGLSSTLSAEFTQTGTISHIEGADLFALSDAALTAAVDRIRDNNIDASAAFSVATDVIRIQQGAGDDFAEFSFTANTARSRDFASSQEAAFSLTADVSEIVQLESTLTSNSTVETAVGKILDASSTQNAEVSVIAAIDGTLEGASELSSQFTITATISHIEGADLVAFTEAAVSVDGERIRFGTIELTTASALSADVEQFKGIIELIASAGTLTATATKTAAITRTLSSAASVFANFDKLFAAPVQFSGGSYDTAVINTSTKKFGAGSLGWTSDSDVFPSSAVFWTGTEFVTANASFKWTSSDGETWTRTAITGGLVPSNFANGYFFNGQQYSTDLNTWTTITATASTLGGGASFIGTVYWAGDRYYVMVGYSASFNYRMGYLRSTTLNGTWTGSETDNLGSNSDSRNLPQVEEFVQGSNFFTTISKPGSGNANPLIIRHFSGTTVTSLASTAPLVVINTNNFQYESNIAVGVKSTTQFLYASTDTQNPNRSALTYKNGASTGSFGFGSSSTFYKISSISYENSTWFVATSNGLYRSTATVPTSFSDFTLVSDTAVGRVRFASSKYFIGSTNYSNDSITWINEVPDNTSGYTGSLEYSQGDGSDLGNFSTVDFWAYIPNSLLSLPPVIRFVSQTNRNNLFQLRLLRTEGGTLGIFVDRITGSDTTSNSYNVFSISTTTDWHHFRISVSGSSLAVYYDGERKIYQTDFLGTFAGRAILYSNGSLLLDEVLVSDTLYTNPTVTSFSVPTTRWVRDSNTDLLLRFDTDFSNEADLAPVIPRATISAAFSQTTTPVKTAIFASSLTSQFEQTVEGTVFVLFEADLSSEFTQTAESIKYRPFDSALSSEFTQTSDANKTAELSSAQASEFTSSTEAVKTTDIVLALDSQATLTGTISHIEGADLVALSDAALTSTGNITRQLASAQASEFSVTADNSRTRLFDSTQNSEFALIGTASVFTDFNSDQASEFSLTADNDRIRLFASQQASEFTLTADNSRTRTVNGNFVVEASQTAAANAVKNAVIVTEAIAINLVAVVKIAVLDAIGFTAFTDLTVNTRVVYSAGSTVTVNAVATPLVRKTATASSALTSSFAQDTFVEPRVRDQSADLTSAIELTASVDKFSGTALLANIVAELAAVNDRFRSFDSALASTVEQTAQVAVTRTTSAALASEFAFTATISHIEGADIIAEGFATLTANVEAGKFGASTQSAAFAQSASAVKTTDVISSQSVVANFAGSIDDRVRDQNAAMSSAFTVACTISHIEGAEIVAENFATLVAEGDIIAVFEMSATSAVNFTATVDKFRAFNANLAASTSLIANGSRIRLGLGTLQAQATIQANAGNLLLASASITSAMTFVAAVREIDLDSINQVVYIIPREVWTYTIAEEIWTRTIPAETRIYTIKEE